jgi:hypothetical protein
MFGCIQTRTGNCSDEITSRQSLVNVGLRDTNRPILL